MSKYTLVDIFINDYPYRKQGKNAGRNHIPVDECTPNHPYAVTLKEFKAIIRAYFKHAIDVMFETGLDLKLPRHMGIVKLRKFPLKIIKAKGGRVYRNYFKYFTKLYWGRSGRQAKFRNKMFWGFKQGNMVDRQIWNTINKLPSSVYNVKDK